MFKDVRENHDVKRRDVRKLLKKHLAKLGVWKRAVRPSRLDRPFVQVNPKHPVATLRKWQSDVPTMAATNLEDRDITRATALRGSESIEAINEEEGFLAMPVHELDEFVKMRRWARTRPVDPRGLSVQSRLRSRQRNSRPYPLRADGG